MSERPATPGSLLLGSILVADEPAHGGVAIFDGNGSLLLTFALREGADIGQIMLGLSAHQAKQLHGWLVQALPSIERAIDGGLGGPQFPAGEIEPVRFPDGKPPFRPT